MQRKEYPLTQEDDKHKHLIAKELRDDWKYFDPKIREEFYSLQKEINDNKANAGREKHLDDYEEALKPAEFEMKRYNVKPAQFVQGLLGVSARLANPNTQYQEIEQIAKANGIDLTAFSDPDRLTLAQAEKHLEFVEKQKGMSKASGTFKAWAKDKLHVGDDPVSMQVRRKIVELIVTQPDKYHVPGKFQENLGFDLDSARETALNELGLELEAPKKTVQPQKPKPNSGKAPKKEPVTVRDSLRNAIRQQRAAQAQG